MRARHRRRDGSAQRRVVPGGLWLIAVALGLASVTTLGVMVALGMNPIGARRTIPIGGMIIGNTTNVASVIALRIVQNTATHRGRGRARSRSGHRGARHPATHPPARHGAGHRQHEDDGDRLSPRGEDRLILAGAQPLQAVRLQLVVMFMLIAATGLAVTMVTWLMTSRLFTPRQQLRRLDGEPARSPTVHRPGSREGSRAGPASADPARTGPKTPMRTAARAGGLSAPDPAARRRAPLARSRSPYSGWTSRQVFGTRRVADGKRVSRLAMQLSL